MLVRHVAVALRLLQRNSLARSRVCKRSFIITKSRTRFQITVNTPEIVVRAVSFQIISWGNSMFSICYYNILGPRSLACYALKSLGEKEIEALSELHLFIKTWQFTLFHSFEGEWEVLSS
jgi:hypothetical protein